MSECVDVLGDKESAADKPRANRPPAIDDEQRDRDSRIGSEASTSAKRSPDRLPPADRNDHCEPDDRGGDGPALITCEAGSCQSDSRASGHWLRVVQPLSG